MFNKFSERIVDAGAGGGGSAYPGGTTGQILTKDSATDYDASWQTWSPVSQFGGTLTNNELVLGAGPNLVKVLGTLGTSGQVLHGNAGGAPTFSPVDLSFDVTGNLPVSNLDSGSGATADTSWHGNGTWAKTSLATGVVDNLPVANLNSGTGASATTFWRGDGTWATPSGGGSLGPVVPYAVVLGDTTSTVTSMPTTGTTGYILTANSGGAPSWTAPSSLILPYIKYSPNYLYNSSFMVRNATASSSVSVTTTLGTASKICDRWYAQAYGSGWTTEISTSDDASYLKVTRSSGSDTDLLIGQCFTTEDSVRLINKPLKVMVECYTDVPSPDHAVMEIGIYEGEGINESVVDMIEGSWTTASYGSSTNNISLVSGSTQEYSFSVYPATTQVGVLLTISFSSSTYAATDVVYIKTALIVDENASVALDSKNLAASKEECRHYYQELDLYLTDSFISIPIGMRAVPTITIDPADSFTTTGTTKDSLIIKVDSSGDSGIHTVYLDCEL